MVIFFTITIPDNAHFYGFDAKILQHIPFTSSNTNALSSGCVVVFLFSFLWAYVKLIWNSPKKKLKLLN